MLCFLRRQKKKATPMRMKALIPTPTPTPTAALFEDLDSVEASGMGVLEGVVVAAALVALVIVADALGDEVDEAEDVCVCVKLSPMMVNV
jgi:hypothetical protein